MATFRFIGDYAESEGVLYSRFGQSVEMAEQTARAKALDGVALIPTADFEFTEEECSRYSTAIARKDAPAGFLERYAAALEALYKFKEAV